MSIKYLGQPFDIHTGGVDLIFPHHTNEIAQAECAAEGTKFVNCWLHNAHLIVNGEKMSKSKNNFFTLRELLKKGYDPKAIRYQLLATHYRQQLNFTEDSLKQIPATLQKFYDFLDKLQDVDCEKDNLKVQKLIETAKEKFETAMDDDLNISGALGAIFEFMRDINKLMSENKMSSSDADEVHDTMMTFDQVLGVMEHETEELSEELLALIEKREEARAKKNFKLADKIREELKEKGIILDDAAKGTKWRRA